VNKIDIENISIGANASIRDAMQAIGRGELGVAFVTDDAGAFLRVLTDGDIRRSLLSGYGLKSDIDVIEHQEPIIVSVDTPLEKISSLFSEKIRAIPVLDDANHIVDVHFHDKRTHIAVTNPLFDDEEIELVSECIISGWVSSGGPFVKKFEQLMADYCNVKYAVSCSSATAGLHLSLMAANIGPGDEVIVPSLTFIATANAVTYTGAKPVFVDSEIETWNIDPGRIKEAITKRTKAIIPVHLYGHPADMDLINDIADDYNLLVIEDAAEAQGAIYKDRIVGSLSHIAIFSFFGNKVITTGEGGMIVTNNEEIAEKCRILRDHGMSPDKRYWHEVIGYNYRMTNMQAALGVAQMGKIEKIISRKKEIAEEYKKHFQDIPGITLPANMEWAQSVYWLYTILIDNKITGCKVEKLMSALKAQGIDSRPVFPPVHTQPVYKNDRSLPVSEKISSIGISLPSASEIRDEDIKKVCDVILNNIGSD